MAEEREKKRKKSSSHASGEPAPAPARETKDMKAGELLRHVRTEKGMELEEVSSAINVRVVQLRAIEEGHIDSLPGMTYAMGFVKSYATFLKLDPTAIANKFKTEHSVAPAKPDLKFPEPISEHKMPDLFMIGAGVAAVIVLLGAWFFFSGGEDKTMNVASSIPPPPKEIAPLTAGTSSSTTETSSASTALSTASTAATNTTTAAAGSVTPSSSTTAPATTAAASAAPVTGTKPAAAKPLVAETATKPAAAAPTASKAPAKPAATALATAAPAVAKADTIAPASGTDRQAAQAPAKTETINIHPGNGRVVLQATQSTWIQVTDSAGNVRYKHLLSPGERYYAPDEPGMHMVTSNAGGLNVIVDGRQAPALGQPGQIVRGIPLNPDMLRRGGTVSGSSPSQSQSLYHASTSRPLVHD